MATATQKITLASARDIPFNKLVLSQANVRRVKAGVSVEELAESIARRGLIQSLHVRPVLDAEGKETGEKRVVSKDEGLRESSLEKLATLNPVMPGGIHTAGSSSQVSDGASAVLLASPEKAKALGLKPRARIVATTLVGVDPETMRGIVTDVAIKRKVRDWVDAAHGTEARRKIYVQHGQYLSETRNRVFGERKKSGTPTASEAEQWMCDEFFDVRMFGAVLPIKGSDSGQVRGPIQLTFATSVDPIVPLEAAIVGPAQNAEQSRRNKPKRDETADDAEEDREARGTMGRKAFVPYGLYRAHGFFVPSFAARTNADEDDLALFWEALQRMWDLDRSASRGEVALRGLYVFSHDSGLGNAPAHKLFERVAVPPVVPMEGGIDVRPPRSFADYTVTVDGSGLEEKGVTLTPLEG